MLPWKKKGSLLIWLSVLIWGNYYGLSDETSIQSQASLWKTVGDHRDTQKRRNPCDHRSRNWSNVFLMWFPPTPVSRNACNLQKVEEARDGFSHRAPGATKPWFWTSALFQNYEQIYFFCLKLQSLWKFIMQTQEINMLLNTLRSKQNNIKCHCGYKTLQKSSQLFLIKKCNRFYFGS